MLSCIAQNAWVNGNLTHKRKRMKTDKMMVLPMSKRAVMQCANEW